MLFLSWRFTCSFSSLWERRFLHCFTPKMRQTLLDDTVPAMTLEHMSTRKSYPINMVVLLTDSLFWFHRNVNARYSFFAISSPNVSITVTVRHYFSSVHGYYISQRSAKIPLKSAGIERISWTWSVGSKWTEFTKTSKKIFCIHYSTESPY